MPILHTHIVPHPPLIVPSVGRGRESEIQATVDAYRCIADSIAADQPDLIIFITPHGKIYEDYIHIAPGREAEGDFSRFGAPQAYAMLEYDEAFIKHLSVVSTQRGIPAGTLGGRDGKQIDHGVLVPLHFIHEKYSKFKAVRASISGLSPAKHYQFGQCLCDAVNDTERRAVIIASGDLSHKLTDDGPYGYAPEGPDFDKQLCDVLRRGDFLQLLQFDPTFCDKAAECGLRSFIMMAGALDSQNVNITFHTYEGPFGVGYAVCSFEPGHKNEERCFLKQYMKMQAEKINECRQQEDAYVQLARRTLETYVKSGELAPLPENLPEEMLLKQAGTFVSIKKEGRLRGCIGTTEPYRRNIAEEIIGNAISAGTKDPRFDAVTEDELPHLVYSVDVLSPAEPIESRDALDVIRYGVIVTLGHKRGLLLPNLDGVDTVEQQIAIALQKAGINASEEYALSRFEVVRHT